MLRTHQTRRPKTPRRASAAATDRPVHETATFFAVTIAATWIVWIVLYRSGILSEPGARIIGTWAPTLTAIALTAGERGLKGVGTLLRRLLIWRAHPLWYAFAIGSTAVIVVVAIAAHRALGGVAVSDNDPAQWYLVFPGFASIFFVSVLGEEVGWRGYALPRLQGRFGPLRASLVIGTIWGVWHLPLWWMGGNFHAQIPFGLFVLQDIALAIVMTWMLNRTGGSLLLVSILHAASNLTIGVAPLLPQYTGGSLLPLWVAVGLLSAGAAVIATIWLREGDRPVVLR